MSHSFANHLISGRIHVKNEQSKLVLDRDNKSHGRMNEQSKLIIKLWLFILLNQNFC